MQRFQLRRIPESYASHLKLWINLKDKSKGKTELFVYHRVPDQYSFQLKDFWGKNLMTAVLKRDSILVTYPQEHQFIYASISEFTQSEYWAWEVSPVQLLELIDGRWARDATQVRFVKRSGDLYEYQARKEEIEVKFALSQDDAFLRNLSLIQPSGNLLARVKLEGNRIYKGFVRPRRLELKLGQGDDIKVGILEEKFDLNLPDKYFEFGFPPLAEKISLN